MKQVASVRLFGAAPVLVVLLVGCLGTTIPDGDESGSGGAGSSESGSGGAGNEQSASGGTSPSSTGGASGGTMSEADWQALTAPIPGPHAIWTRDLCEEPHVGSTSVAVGPEYSVIPIVGTSARPGSTVEYGIYDAVLMPYCLSSADCTDAPGGVCQGIIEDAYCQYAEPLPPDTCEVDADCTTKPDGTCVLPLGPEAQTICYPTGVCEQGTGACTYAGDTPCTSDADCTESADGECIFPVRVTVCAYGTCHEDADCDAGQRCGCGFCVEADCTSDDSCPEGETCEMGQSSCHGHGSFNCSTPNDECEAGTSGCYFWPGDGGYWSGQRCLVR